MTRYFYDTEFIEDGRTIDLISIGIVARDGIGARHIREYYAINAAIASPLNHPGGDELMYDRIRARPWLMNNVVAHLPLREKNGIDVESRRFALDTSSPVIKPRWLIANEVREFITEGPDVELWADYGAYDHIVLMQLFGAMMARPDWFPMWTHDLQQALAAAGITDPDQRWPHEGTVHNALEDARQVERVWNGLNRNGPL